MQGNGNSGPITISKETVWPITDSCRLLEDSGCSRIKRDRQELISDKFQKHICGVIRSQKYDVIIQVLKFTDQNNIKYLNKACVFVHEAALEQMYSRYQRHLDSALVSREVNCHRAAVQQERNSHNFEHPMCPYRLLFHKLNQSDFKFEAMLPFCES